MHSENDLKIILDKKGSRYYSKVSYPLRFGRYTQIDTRDYIFCFDLNNRIKIIQSKNRKLHNLNEWLKLTVSNEWIYYSAAGYKGVRSFIGEYYLPCFSYSANPLFKTYAYDKNLVNGILNDFSRFLDKPGNTQNLSQDVKNKFQLIVSANHPAKLQKIAEEFHSITSGMITVLPPDSRHVDYEVIPVNVADGCLYNCDFCSVKTGKNFAVRDKMDILSQIQKLKRFYGPDINNCNSLFLGQHDALNAGADIILYAAQKAYKEFDFKFSYMKNPMLFLFGSVDSLLNSREILYKDLNDLPFYTYINIGMESADQGALNMLKKPLNVKKVEMAFDRMLQINREYMGIEVTANFVMGGYLNDQHYESILRLAKSRLQGPYGKGCFYFSPLENPGTTRYIQKKFIWLKNSSPVQAYIYLIQRL